MPENNYTGAENPEHYRQKDRHDLCWDIVQMVKDNGPWTYDDLQDLMERVQLNAEMVEE